MSTEAKKSGGIPTGSGRAKMKTQPALEVRDLYRFYHTGEEETLALRGVSFQVKSGELVAIMGPSGSGKSTLLSCISGIAEPDGGCVTISGTRITRKTEIERAAIRAAKMGIMLQSGSLFDQLSVYDNMLMKMWLAGKINRKRIDSLVEAVGLAERLHALPSRMSGGETARASLAVALASDPDILLADEPTGEVDEANEEQLIRLFESYRENGGAAIIATHSDSVIARVDRVICLHDGRIVEEK
jgi:putative ABC transport system ATP-binding protein